MMELKPCPFCGGRADFDKEEIRCDCGAQMPYPLWVIGKNSVGGFPTYEEAKAIAAEEWNRRAT